MQSSIAPAAQDGQRDVFPATGPSGDIVKASCDEQKIYHASMITKRSMLNRKNFVGRLLLFMVPTQAQQSCGGLHEKNTSKCVSGKVLVARGFLKKPTKTSHTSVHDDQPNLAS